MKSIFLLAGCLALVNASEKGPETTLPPSQLSLLTAKPWRVTALTSSTTSGTGIAKTTNEYAAMPTCLRDDFFKFNPDKTTLRDEGATKCDATSPQTKKYTWDFNGDQTQLLLTPTGKTKADSPSDILELTATTLRLHTTTTISPGVVITQNITFTAF